jgi:hypothetical protein
MSGDSIRKDDQGKQQTTRKQQTTEAGEAVHALVGDMLFGSKPPPQDRTRIVLGIDATSSMDEFIPARRMTPEAAATIAEAIYAKAPSALVDIMVFRGDDKNSQQPRQLKEFKGIETAAKLTRLLQGIEHAPGWTQHCHLLRKVAERAKEQAIQQFVLSVTRGDRTVMIWRRQLFMHSGCATWVSRFRLVIRAPLAALARWTAPVLVPSRYFATLSTRMVIRATSFCLIRDLI